jgi:N-dimethylarginine dimethylaminohydrolase
METTMSIMTEGEYRYNMLIKRFPSAPEPTFESKDQQEYIWGRRWGCNNDVGRLRMVLMHRPGDELKIVDASKRLDDIGAFGDPETGWYWRGNKVPPLEAMQMEHDALVAALKAEGVEVINVERNAMLPGKMKTVYTRDSVIVVDGGAIVTRLGPPIRRGEERAVTQTLVHIGMPILRTIHGAGIMEGGSFAFINPKTVVIGISSRVNEEGTRQVEEVLKVMGVEVIRVHLTGYRLHIDGAFVMIDVDTAIINPTQLPFWFLEKLKEMKIRTIEVHPDDGVSTINCLAVRPGRIIASDQVSNRTLDALDRAGISVIKVGYENMYLGGGGIHCSTSPLARDPI